VSSTLSVNALYINFQCDTVILNDVTNVKNADRECHYMLQRFDMNKIFLE
jgi:hypothetical protein